MVAVGWVDCRNSQVSLQHSMAQTCVEALVKRSESPSTLNLPNIDRSRIGHIGNIVLFNQMGNAPLNLNPEPEAL